MENLKKRLVVKVGTGVLTCTEGPQLDEEQFQRIGDAVSALVKAGHECLLVSSGAVGAGIGVLGLEKYPKETSTRQACAAVGQIQLVQRYERLFREHDIEVAQLLLTRQDIETDDRRQRVLATIRALLNREGTQIVPIINENDSVAVEELKFGDNDTLAARVATMIEADLLILLTGVDGLLPAGGMSDGAKAEPIAEITDIDAAMAEVAPIKGRFSMGGMASKLAAIRTATEGGVAAIIASGHRLEQLSDLVDGGGICTRFPAAESGKDSNSSN